MIPLTKHRSHSMVNRLTMYYGMLTCLLLGLGSGASYWTLRQELLEDDTKLLDAQVMTIKRALSSIDAHVSRQESTAPWIDTLLADPRFGGRLVSAQDRQMVAESSTMRVPVQAFLPKGMAMEDFFLPLPDTGHVRYMLRTAQASDARHHVLDVQVALDRSDEDRLLERYRERLYLVLVFGTLAGGWLGRVLARLSLAPLQRMSQAAARVTAKNLHERMEPARWPTELKALAATLDDMLARLEESFARLHAFSADLAHELRTPVHHLMGETEVALGRPREPEDYRALLESNLEEFGHLSRMIDSMLFLARADTQDIRIDATRIDVADELASLKDFFDAMAEERGIEIRCEGLAHTHADPALFRRAVGNLIANALRFSPQGGKIILHTERTNSGDTLVSVSDEGPGIALSHQDKIFDRFFQGHEARADGGSTGLGLAIVHSIMRLHGGSVALWRTGANGTTFRLVFSDDGVHRESS